MNLPKKCTATDSAPCGRRWLVLLALWACHALALAAPVAGTVVQLSGPLLAKKANGAVKILSMKSEVENGDTLVTEKNTYAMVRFIDNSEITLRPGTTMTVENFSFDNDKQDGDQASFNLVKGGLRSVTGLLGKRSKEKFSLKTPAATIGIRGTTFVAQYIEPDEAQALAAAVAFLNASTAALASDAGPIAPVLLAQLPSLPRPAASSPTLAPGLYVHVIDGLIQLSNGGGTSQFAPGQFGYTPSFKQPPALLPANPGIQFTLPQAFIPSTSSSNGGSGGDKPKTVDCEVR